MIYASFVLFVIYLKYILHLLKGLQSYCYFVYVRPNRSAQANLYSYHTPATITIWWQRWDHPYIGPFPFEDTNHLIKIEFQVYDTSVLVQRPLQKKFTIYGVRRFRSLRQRTSGQFFQKYTKIDITLLELHTHKFPTPLLCVKRDLRPLIVKSINTSTQRSSRCYLNLRSDELNDMVPHTVIRIHQKQSEPIIYFCMRVRRDTQMR